MTSTSDRQYVVLEHDTDPHHFDLMIEHDEGLWTWSLYRDCLPDTINQIKAERIPDHRKAYLTYEGPVSGDRGHVHRVEAGNCRLSDIQPDTRFAGRFDGDDWQFPFRLEKSDRTGPRNHRLWVLTNSERPEPS